MINIGVFNPNNCKFHLRSGSTPHGPWDARIVYDGRTSVGDSLGLVPIAGDWTRKGFDSIGVFGNNSLYVGGGKFSLRNSNTPGVADLEFAFGTGG